MVVVVLVGASMPRIQQFLAIDVSQKDAMSQKGQKFNT
jgi:hypothetical protein